MLLANQTGPAAKLATGRGKPTWWESSETRCLETPRSAATSATPTIRGMLVSTSIASKSDDLDTWMPTSFDPVFRSALFADFLAFDRDPVSLFDPQPTSRDRVVRPMRSIVPDGCSAIDGDRRSLDVACTLRAQEQSERCDILDLAEAADAAFGQCGGAQLLDRHAGRLRSLR
jgi:hypothetical protein